MENNHPGNSPANPGPDSPNGPSDESYMPDYLFLMAGFLAPGMLPTYGYLLPGSSWVPYSELPNLYDPAGIATNKAIPKRLRELYLDFSPALPGAASAPTGVASGVASYLARLRFMVESIASAYEREEAGQRRRLHDSIDRLTLTNEAMFSFLAQEWGVTEDDVTDRIEEIFADEVRKFLAGAVAAESQPA